jgi:hypothetical protein
MGGDRMPLGEEGFLDIVIINAAKISRAYYADEYDRSKPSYPTCWSADTQLPAVEVPEARKQASRCMDCTQNIRGSGKMDSRACKFAQRLAVGLVDDMQQVYHLQLPASSIFGGVKKGHMGLQAYAKFLSTRRTHTMSVVTRLYFDETSAVPKVYFKAIKPLTDTELEVALKLKRSDAASIAALQTVAVSHEPVMATSPFTEVDGFQYKLENTYG